MGCCVEVERKNAVGEAYELDFVVVLMAEVSKRRLRNRFQPRRGLSPAAASSAAAPNPTKKHHASKHNSSRALTLKGQGPAYRRHILLPILHTSLSCNGVQCGHSS